MRFPAAAKAIHEIWADLEKKAIPDEPELIKRCIELGGILNREIDEFLYRSGRNSFFFVDYEKFAPQFLKAFINAIAVFKKRSL